MSNNSDAKTGLIVEIKFNDKAGPVLERINANLDRIHDMLQENARLLLEFTKASLETVNLPLEVSETVGIDDVDDSTTAVD